MNYHALQAKIKTMRSRLFSREEYMKLCRMESVSAIISYLRANTAYAKVLQRPSDGEKETRHHVEQRLTLSMAEELSRVKTFACSNRHDYFECQSLQMEIQLVKQLLCMVFDRRDITYTIPEPQLLTRQEKKLDLVKLTSARTVSEFIQGLRNADYYPMLAAVYEERHSLIALETQLDLYYYLHCWHEYSKLTDKENREVLIHIKGSEIDLHNIMWAYRLKNYYRITGTQMYQFLIPVYYRLSKAALNKIAENQDIGSIAITLRDTPYADVFADFSRMKNYYVKAMREYIDDTVRSHPNSLAVVVRYFFEKRMEIQNLISLVEGVRYSLSPEEVMEYLNI